jgi:hypothetical protein
VGRVKEKGRTERRHSDFYLGIHALFWVESLQMFEIEMRTLMNLSPGKRANYQRGMRGGKPYPICFVAFLVTPSAKTHPINIHSSRILASSFRHNLYVLHRYQ